MGLSVSEPAVLTRNTLPAPGQVPTQRYPYAEYSELAGPFQPLPEGPYQVQYVSLVRQAKASFRALSLAAAAVIVELVFLVWLLLPGHYPHGHGALVTWAGSAGVACIAALELVRLLNITTLCLATMQSRDPVPVAPEAGKRVAFLTTMVPGKEPIEMVRRTLESARLMRYDGVIDVWLLDEGDDPAVRSMCRQVGARHFSRKGVARWNQEHGPHRRKTKHGNYNAWLDHHGDEYDFFVSVDPDHVPMANFVERLLGYFRDPDVAFVVAPQVYGNYEGFLTRSAESQQYLFHSVVQRAGNRNNCAMLVGTNNAMRISALRAIGGLRDSLTEDAATSFAWHAKRNPETNQRWKSVYTPDVLAVGEGPVSWTDYFNQQLRWSRGACDLVLSDFWKRRQRLGLRRRLHYSLIFAYYPSVALAWIIGAFNTALYMASGVGTLQVTGRTWLMLYVDAGILQLAIYFWNRRHNISPHEQEGSSGVSGMFLSVLTIPIYVAALIGSIGRRQAEFQVTPKDVTTSPDTVRTFSKHLRWAAFLAAMLTISFPLGHDQWGMRAWCGTAVLVCLLPVFVFMWGNRRRRHAASSSPAESPAALATVTTLRPPAQPDARDFSEERVIDLTDRPGSHSSRPGNVITLASAAEVSR